MEEMLQVGVIASTHGIKGEVKVFPTTDDAGRFRELKSVLLDTGKEMLELEIAGVKFFKQFVILGFKGINDINEIERYKGKRLFVTRENAVKLQKDEYFISDLLGIRVTEEDGKALGVLKDVIETGANDVYVIERNGGGEVLIPAIKQCILAVDIEKREMLVHLLEGLMD